MSETSNSTPLFFATAGDFRAWLEANHETATELLVGFYKKGTGRPSIDWPQSVEQALCFGWIDGVRRTIDGESYSIRFSPRKPRSNWSAINIRTVERLLAESRMYPAGLRAFELRQENRSGVYSFEQQSVEFDPIHEQRFREHPAAWEYFQSRPPSYRKPATWWVVSAKREETRLKRLDQLIADSAAGRTIRLLTPPAKRE